MTLKRLALPATVVLAWVACKDSTAPVMVPHPASLIVPESAVVLEADSIQLNAQLKDSAGQAITGVPVIWLIGDTAIATVSAGGMVHFKQVGRTTIGVLSGGLTGHTTLTAAVQIQQLDLGSVYAQLSPTGCAVTAKGSVYCLDAQHQDSLRPLATNVGPVKQVAVGTNQSCLLTVAGAAYCWGSNDQGQLGYDTTLVSYPPVTSPVPVKGGHAFQAITSGISHTCGLTSTGAAYCWGANSSGQLGNGDTTVKSSTTPLAVTGGLAFKSIAAGDTHTCAVTTGGAAYCWGDNYGLELGSADSTIPRSYVPVAAALDSPATRIVAGALYGCALSASGAASCWGNSQWGQLGVDSASLYTCPTIPSAFVCSHSPHLVSGGHQFQVLGAHAGIGNALDGLTCGLTTTGSAYCWGRNVLGEVGDGTNTERDTPVAVSGGLTFTTIAVGDFHACGFTSGGTVYCWGYTMGLHPARIPDQP